MEDHSSLTQTASFRSRAASLPILLGGNLAKRDSSLSPLRRHNQTEPDSYEHFIETEQKKDLNENITTGRSILGRMRQWLKKTPPKEQESTQKAEEITVPESATFEELQHKIDSLVEENINKEREAFEARSEVSRLLTDHVICLSTLDDCNDSCDVLISRARVLATALEEGVFTVEDIAQRRDSFIEEIKTLKRNLLDLSDRLVQSDTQKQIQKDTVCLNHSFDRNIDKHYINAELQLQASPLEKQLTSMDEILTALTCRTKEKEVVSAVQEESIHTKHGETSIILQQQNMKPQESCTTLVSPAQSSIHSMKNDPDEFESISVYKVETRQEMQMHKLEEIKNKVAVVLQQQNRVEQELKQLSEVHQEIAELTPTILSSLQNQLSSYFIAFQSNQKSVQVSHGTHFADPEAKDLN